MPTEIETYLLPGFSPRNKDWAEGVKAELEPDVPVVVINWPHWQEGVEKEPDWITKEADKIITGAGDSKFNILAKSAGTLVALMVLSKRPDLVEKLILCGVPFSTFEPGDEKFFDPLKTFSPEKLLVIQNENDKVASHKQIQEFLRSLNPNINVVSKPGDTHDYPYPEDFKAFLKS